MIALQHTPEWHQERLQGVGASDAGSVVGLGHLSPLTLWKIKTGEIPEPDLSELPEIKWGKIFEDGVAIGLQIEQPTWVLRRKTITVWSREYPFAFAHLDRTINDGEHAGIPGEIKTAAYPDDWGESWTEDIPAYYMPQIQHEIAVTGKPYAYLIVLILSTRELRTYRIMRNDEYIEKLMRREETFWDAVEDRVPPAPINAADVIGLFPDPTGTIEATDDALLMATRYLVINRMLASLKDEKEALRDKLAVVFGEADTLSAGQRTIATFKQRAQSFFDEARLKVERPDIYEEYMVRTSSRTLLVKK